MIQIFLVIFISSVSHNNSLWSLRSSNRVSTSAKQNCIIVMAFKTKVGVGHLQCVSCGVKKLYNAEEHQHHLYQLMHYYIRGQVTSRFRFEIHMKDQYSILHGIQLETMTRRGVILFGSPFLFKVHPMMPTTHRCNAIDMEIIMWYMQPICNMMIRAIEYHANNYLRKLKVRLGFLGT